MIRINLLPEKEVKRGRRRAEAAAPSAQSSPLVLLILLALIAGVGGYYYYYVRLPLVEARDAEAQLQKEIRDIDAELDKRRTTVAMLKEIQSAGANLLEVVQALDPDERILWSEKMNYLTDLKPDNVFVTQITVDERIENKETPSSVRRRDEARVRIEAAKAKAKANEKVDERLPDQTFYPEITQTLSIKGIAYSENQAERIRLINEFYDNLQKGRNERKNKDLTVDFMHGFKDNIEFPSFTPQVVGERNVAEFTFTLETIPTGPKEGAPSAAGGQNVQRQG